MGFTKEQMEAINTEGKNLIVSAGAGSGKTAVLTERVIRKLKDGIDVDRLLVLTFTNEAANEMKSRIREAIIKNNLNSQLGLLDSAYITTFDSYALSVVKKYHYLLNISPNIKIIDSNIILIKKYKIIDEIFDSFYGNSLFDKLVTDFCLKDDKILKDYIINISSKLELLIDKQLYLDTYLDTYYNDNYLLNLSNSYLELITSRIMELKNLYDKFTSYINDSLIQKLDNYFRPLFNGTTYDEYRLFNTMEAVRFTKVDEDGEQLKNLIKSKITDIKHLLRFESITDIIDSIKKTYDYSKIIIEIITKLDKYISEYKSKYDVYEFNDIAHMAIKIVKNNSDARDELKYYFNEIMVDEYQDTSDIQEEFISNIANNNVYLVGDIKQSIYRFRNANPYIFQCKYDEYSKNINGMKIDLLKNFRSRNETLFGINEIFNLIMDNDIGNADYQDSHNMIYGNLAYDNEKTSENYNLEIYNYDNSDKEYFSYEKELFIIADDINNKISNNYQIFDKKTSKLRPLKYSDICIITDRNKYLDKYKKILEYNNIPSVLYKDDDLTNGIDILVLKNLIKLVDYVSKKIYDDVFRYLFTSIARSFLFNYHDNNIYQILKNKTYKDDNIVKMCQSIDTTLPLNNVILNIIDVFNFYDKLTTLNNIDCSLVRIDNLLDIANNLSLLDYDLVSFIEYLDDVVKNGLTVKYSTNTSGGEAVKIMNIHKSKGLEFSVCYFTGMNNKFTIKEIKDKIIFDNKYGIIIPYMKEELEDTIIKDMYINNYFIEEISEKIRLLYVSLTRCREKMIILASLNNDTEKYSGMVPSEERLRYRSFLDILNSLNVIDKYVTLRDANYTHDYDQIKLKDITGFNNNDIIAKHNLNITYNELSNKHFSKTTKKLLDKDTIKMMDLGTKIHEELEYADFNRLDNDKLKLLFENIDRNYLNAYKEYEFIYYEDNIRYHGIIDLLLEYNDYFNIIDYKLKNIDDENYLKQLTGYKNYIESISSKPVNIYLYSILDNKLLKL